MAEKIEDQFDTPFSVEGFQLKVNFSIGISFFPKDGTDMLTLIDRADQAMYKAKESRKHHFSFYSANKEKHSS